MPRVARLTIKRSFGESQVAVFTVDGEVPTYAEAFLTAEGPTPEWLETLPQR